MASTVETRLVGSDLGRTMGAMRTWLDHRKVVPCGFRQSGSPGGMALHVEFNASSDADDFAANFNGWVLGTRPRPSGLPEAAFAERYREVEHG